MFSTIDASGNGKAMRARAAKRFLTDRPSSLWIRKACQPFQEAQLVMIQGLRSQPAMNGTHAKIINYNNSTDKYLVQRFESSLLYEVKSANLVTISP